MSKPPPKKVNVRANQGSRSRNGCLTCRARHIKCDENFPECHNCAKSNKICQRGRRLNFFKTTTSANIKFHKFKKSSIRFLDQSYTIHKVYQKNNFHNYRNWMTNHSKQELFESDLDFNNAIELSKQTNSFSDSQSKNLLKVISVVELSDKSDTDSASHYPSISISTNMNKQPFNISYFLNKVLSYFVAPILEQTLFVNSHRNSIIHHSQGFNLSSTIIDNKLTLSEFHRFMEIVEENEHSIQERKGPITKMKDPTSNFTLFLNSLVFSLKTKRIDLFQQPLAGQEVIEFVNKRINDERYQTFENLMNYFELLVLDLNASLESRALPSLFTSVHGEHPESFDYLLSKILNLNLFDDVNYFIIRIIIIIIKLNNFRHSQTTTQMDMESLMMILHDLKNLEHNPIVSMYFPKLSFVSENHVPSSQHRTDVLSRSSANIPAAHNSRETPHSSHPQIPVHFDFQNLKVQRFHVLYNFVLSFVSKEYDSYRNVKNFIFESPSSLLGFWSQFDLKHRMERLISQYDFSDDPFMSFITKW